MSLTAVSTRTKCTTPIFDKEVTKATKASPSLFPEEDLVITTAGPNTDLVTFTTSAGDGVCITIQVFAAATILYWCRYRCLPGSFLNHRETRGMSGQNC